MSDLPLPTPTGNPIMDGEHRIQLGLINALCSAVEAHAEAAQIELILERLVDYSQAHFLSEELLMRLDSYDDFDDHLEDHADMLDSLAALLATHRTGRTELIPNQARRLLTFLVRHIETRDVRYASAPRI